METTLFLGNNRKEPHFSWEIIEYRALIQNRFKMNVLIKELKPVRAGQKIGRGEAKAKPLLQIISSQLAP